MPRDKLLGERFKIKKWKWYVVDFTNLHDPVLIRKHCETKKQARSIIDRYYDKNNYSVVSWKEAELMDLRDYPHFSRRHHKQHIAKYEYPPDRVSQIERQLYRNNERKKMKQKKRLPKVTETAVWEIIEDKPVLFIKRLKAYRDNHWVYSEPVEGLSEFKKHYEWPKDFRHLCNIVRTLNDYYDIGPYDMAQVAMFIYKKWNGRIKSHCDNVSGNPSDKEKVIQEYIARGFIKLTETEFDDSKDSWVESIGIFPPLVYPELAWHTTYDQKLYKHYIYDLYKWVGIPGWSRAVVAGLSKRK